MVSQHLMCAAEGGHEVVAKVLLQHGADVAAAMDVGVTALMSAALGGHEAVAQLLLTARCRCGGSKKRWFPQH